MIYKGKGGKQYELSVKPLAAGGEGEIYDIIGQPKSVAKIYKTGKATNDKEQKLLRMIHYPPEPEALKQIAWPQDLLYDSSYRFVGFVMSKMSLNEDLNVIYEPGSSAKYPEMPWKSKITIAKNLCVVLDCVHKADHICGDFNPKNISVDPDAGYVVFLDTDSYHIQDGNITYRCDVGMPEYLPAEVQNKMRGGGTLATAPLPTFSQDTDNFSLAIHIFQLLMNGIHPFACAILPRQQSVTAPQPTEGITKGESPFMQDIPGIRIPALAPKITILTPEIQQLFRRAFVDGHRNPSNRPKPAEWYEALNNLGGKLVKCGNVPYHQYFKPLSTCPWCDIEKNRFARDIQHKTKLKQETIDSSSVIDLKQRFLDLSVWAKAAIIAIPLLALLAFGLIKGTTTPPLNNQPVERTLTVNFDANGATSIGAVSRNCIISGNADSCTVAAPTIIRNGYNVNGWSTNARGESPMINVGADIILTNSNNGATYYAITTQAKQSTPAKTAAKPQESAKPKPQVPPPVFDATPVTTPSAPVGNSPPVTTPSAPSGDWAPPSVPSGDW